MPLDWSMQDTLACLGHFGWIPPEKRTQAQQDAHAAAVARLPKLGNVNPDLVKTLNDLPKGAKVMLTDFWKQKDVVADIGKPFTGFGQRTGSCVGVSNGNAETTVLCVQRTIAAKPTKAAVAFWGWNYGRCRFKEGDRGPGEGAVDSVMGDVDVEGFLQIGDPGLPGFAWNEDGLWIEGGSQTELKWSYLPDGSALVSQYKDMAAKRAGMTRVTLNSPEEEAAAILNGYAVLTGCSMFVGHGSIRGSGENAYVRGKYDGSGGHSTCRLGVWNHPDDGMLIAYSNQWPTNTYPKDPAGLGRCCVWISLDDEKTMLSRYGGGGGETMLLSHVPGVPAQPSVLDWSRA
jgi:hypothetical protein